METRGSMRTEQQALKVSLAAILVFSALGIGFGLVSGSSAIIFDGVFSLMDAVMSIVSIVVAGLIARSTSVGLSRRFSMGYWHFEPIVLAINALLMMAVASYALVQAVLAIMNGGRDIEFGPAVAYATIVLVLTLVIGFAEYRANKKINSALVAMDIKGWLMAGGVTGALLVAFLIGMLIDGTRIEWLMPYVDPAVLVLVALVLIPVPVGTLRKALAEIAMVTPRALIDEAQNVADAIVEQEGFNEAIVYAAQVGRGRRIEVNFLVPDGDEAIRPLPEWDAIRQRVTNALANGDPNHWITVVFTTKRELA